MIFRSGYSLPKGYIELEYIENTSIANLNTGITALNKEFVIDLQFTSNDTRQLMGISGSSSAYWGNNKGTWEKIGTTGTSFTTLDRVKVHFDIGNITSQRTNTWLEGATNKYAGSDTNWATASGNPFRIFTLAGSGYNCKMKLFGVKVYNSQGKVVNNLIPCRRSSDNIDGVYDAVTDTFIAVTGTVTEGNEVQRKTKFNVASYKINAAFEQREYIQSSGTQYINTGWYWHSETTKIEADIMVTSNSSNQSLWGNEEYQTASTSNRYFSGIPHGSNGSYSYYVGTGAQSGLSIGMNTRVLVVATTNDSKQVTVTVNGTVKINAKTYSGTCQAHTATFTSDSKGLIYICCNHNSNKTTNYSPTQNVGGMRIYRFKMWDDGVLVRDFVPVKRKSDNAIGLYDLIENKFYANAGSGNFTASDGVIGYLPIQKFIAN